MTNKKIIAVILMLTAVLLGTSGCFGGTNRKKEKVLSHLESKYGESFEIVSFYGENIDMPYDEIICQNKNGELFSVSIENDGLKQIIHDDYYGIVIADEYREYVEEILDHYISDYKYFFNFTCGHFEDEFDASTQLSEALDVNATGMFTNNIVFVNQNTAKQLDEALFDALCNELRENSLEIYLAIYEKDDSEYAIIDETQDVNQYILNDFGSVKIFAETIN